MTAPTTVPVAITPEAAERLAELGMMAELERMLEHTRYAVPGVLAMKVVLRPMYDTYEDTGITIEAPVGANFRPDELIWSEWIDWLHATFPPQVFEHFDLRIVPGTTHAG